jgi:hypothetical protein
VNVYGPVVSTARKWGDQNRAWHCKHLAGYGVSIERKEKDIASGPSPWMKKIGSRLRMNEFKWIAQPLSTSETLLI